MLISNDIYVQPLEEITNVILKTFWNMLQRDTRFLNSMVMLNLHIALCT